MTRTHLMMLLITTAIAPIIWGSTYIVTTELLPANSPLMASLIRALPAGIILIVATRSLPEGRWWYRIALLGLLNIGFFFYCLFYAATHLPGGMAALVMSSQPILVIVFSSVLLSSRITTRQLIAGVIGVAGIGLLVVNSKVVLDVGGVTVALLGTVSMAFGVVLTKKWGRPSNMNLLGFTGWQLFFGGVLLAPAALTMEGIPATVTTANVMGYLYLSLFGAIVSYYLWFRGIEKLPTVSVSFLGFLSSVSACVLGYVFLEQEFTQLQLIGASAIFASIVLANAKTTQTNQQSIKHNTRTAS